MSTRGADHGQLLLLLLQSLSEVPLLDALGIPGPEEPFDVGGVESGLVGEEPCREGGYLAFVRFVAQFAGVGFDGHDGRVLGIVGARDVVAAPEEDLRADATPQEDWRLPMELLIANLRFVGEAVPPMS